MGVPKFYRWISERYPCLSQVVKDYQIPEFDNFYLDMNGIIHTCSHPNDDDPSFRISEEKIFSDIFTYLEALFRIIKPQKVMFFAIDGVAPRAKMNQQRGRRFRSAREAQDLVRKALQKGQILPSEPRFDSNCITPGTEFMTRLHEHLKYFVSKKLSTDPTWQKVEIVLSGHDVPGEGEHKIMDYIRYRKAQSEYDPNTRHCLYGLDADLIMLGLLSHEPHFSLLREEVRFGRKSQKKQSTPDTVTFHLLHLSILREYLDFEFGCLKDKLKFDYDLEKIIDDWVLMGFLVGNDFLPNLPNLHIRQDALPYLYSKYIEVLPSLGGYINNGGTLNMASFEAYLKAVSKFDYDHYSELFDDLSWLEGKNQLGRDSDSRKKKNKSTQRAQTKKKAESPDQDDAMFPAGLADFAAGGVDDVDYDEESTEMQKLKRDLGIPSLESYFKDEDEDLDKNFEKEFIETKANYYKEKMGFVHVDQTVLFEQAKCYVVGIQWVLHYYYSGVPSWSWFYPFHYAPYVSDVKGFSDILIEFELGTPFHPFEQLLAVLPPASKSLLPRAFWGLMVNDDSTVKDFYPINFETDLNGKQQEWEAVVLIPFIDEGRLLDAMKPCFVHLTDEELNRNGFGKCLVKTFDRDAEPAVYPSPWPQVFPELTNCKLRCIELPPDPFPVSKESMVRGLCPGVKLDVYFPGFPSLKHIKHTGSLEKKGVRVFQTASRGDNLFLIVQNESNKQKDVEKIAQELIGKVIFVDWPYLVEAKVCAVSNGREKYYQASVPTSSRSHDSGRVPMIRNDTLSESGGKQWREEKTIISRYYLERQGIDIGNVELLIYAQVLQGKRYVVNKRGAKGTVCLVKEWSPIPEPFVYQTTVKEITSFAPEYREQATTLSDLFPPKSQCFVISPPHYGSLAEVISVDLNQLRVHVKVVPKPEPDLDVVMDNEHRLSIRYLPSHVVADKVGLPTITLARITGNIQMEKGSRQNVKNREKVKIGLNWKFSKRNQEIIGYARKQDGGGWSFSPEAIRLLKEFIKQFPVMFQYIKDNPKDDMYYEEDLFPNPDGPESVRTVKEWLKKLPSDGVDAVDCGSLTLDKPQIAAIEKAVYDMQRQGGPQMKTVKLRVKPGALFKPIDHQGNLIPDPDADFMLYDRVINVSTTNAVPFALRGTVTGIMGASKDNSPTIYEVLFDEDFLGGLTLRCSSNRSYLLPASCLLSISHGKRLEEERRQEKTGKSYTQSGSYASAASYHQYEQPRTYQQYGSYSGAPIYTHPGYQGYDMPDNAPARYTGTRHENRDRGMRYGNEKVPRGEREISHDRGRGKGDKHAKKVILQRGSSQGQVSTETGKHAHTKGPKGDDFSAAMDALSKLSIASDKSTKESSSGKGQPEETQETRELSPSVAAMFSAHEKQEALVRTEEQSQDHSSNLKSILRIGSSESKKSPTERDLPEAIHKLMGPQHRGPLLPGPPRFQQPQHHVRGPLLPRAPLLPYGPPAMDPLNTLYQTSYSLGHPQPNVFVRNTPKGYVGVVEIGRKKYHGPPCTHSEEAKQSAAAVASSDLNSSRTSLLGYYPPQYPYPYMMPPQPRYDGPPIPHYPRQPPPPRHAPPGPMAYHPTPHPVGGVAIPRPAFVPLQVQRKQRPKSTPEKQTQALPSSMGSPQREQEGSNKETQILKNAKRDILESLNITSPGSSQDVPPGEGGQRTEDEPLANRVEKSLQDARETKENIDRLSSIINAVSAASDDLPVHSETSPVDDTAHTGEPLHVGDAFVHTVIAGGMKESSTDSENYSVAVQPEDTAKPTSDQVTIAGEIVGTTTNLDSKNSLELSGSPNVHDDVTGIGSQSAASSVTPSKKSKRQLAASFMNT